MAADEKDKTDLAKIFKIDPTTTKGWNKLKLLEERENTRKEQLVHFKIYMQEIKGQGRTRWINAFLDKPVAENELHCFIHLFVRAWKEAQTWVQRGVSLRTVQVMKFDGKRFIPIKFPWRELLQSQAGQEMFEEFEIADMPQHPSLDYWPQPL